MRDKKDLLDSKEKFLSWVEQDRASSGYSNSPSWKEYFLNLIAPNYILKFEYQLRKVEYLNNCNSLYFRKIRLLINKFRLRRMQLKMGFTIPINVFGPGLSIPHYGTIVVSQDASVGKNCRLHVGVNIGASAGQPYAPIIGDNVYIGPGAILFGNIHIANGISIGANSTVNKSFDKTNVVIAGTPAHIVRENAPTWNSLNPALNL